MGDASELDSEASCYWKAALLTTVTPTLLLVRDLVLFNVSVFFGGSAGDGTQGPQAHAGVLLLSYLFCSRLC